MVEKHLEILKYAQLLTKDLFLHLDVISSNPSYKYASFSFTKHAPLPYKHIILFYGTINKFTKHVSVKINVI